MPVISTQKKKQSTPSQSSGALGPLKTKQQGVLRLSHVAKNFFLRGVAEIDFLGSAEKVAAKHTKFLAAWLPLAQGTSKEVERKALQEAAGQKLAQSCVNACGKMQGSQETHLEETQEHEDWRDDA